MNLLKKLFGKKNNSTPATTASSPSEKTPEPPPLQITEISPAELQTRLNGNNGVVVVDMRSSWEYQAGHIPGAINIFAQQIPFRFKELPPDAEIIFQCWHGNTSVGACGFLIENGWPANRVNSLQGGMAGWVQAHGQASLEKER